MKKKISILSSAFVLAAAVLALSQVPFVSADTGGHVTAYSRTANHVTASLSGTLGTYFCSVNGINQNVVNIVLAYALTNGTPVPFRGGNEQLSTTINDYAPPGDYWAIGFGCNASVNNNLVVRSGGGTLGLATDPLATQMADTTSGWLATSGDEATSLFVSTGANGNISGTSVSGTIFPAFANKVTAVMKPNLILALGIFAALVGLGIAIYYFKRFVGGRKKA